MGYVESLLGKNEKIIVIARQHWTALAVSFLINLFVAVVLIVLAALLGTLNFIKDPSSILRFIPPVLLVMLLIPVVRFGWHLLRWSAEQYLITTHRVIQTEGIVNKKTVDSSLEKVNDVVLTQSFFGRLLGYGELEIITGSDIGVNKLHRLAEPVRFKTAMLDQKAALGHDAGEDLPRAGAGPSADAEEGDPLKRIAELDDLRKRGAISDEDYQAAKARLLAKL